jgi:hypothetical protein
MTDDAIGTDVQKKARSLVESRMKRDIDAEAAEQSEKAYRENEAEFWMAVEESPLQGAIKIDVGEPYGTVTFQTRETYYGRVLDKDQVLEHFEQRAMIDDVMEPKLSKKRINEIVNDCLDEGKDLPPGLDFYGRRYVTITFKKSK